MVPYAQSRPCCPHAAQAVPAWSHGPFSSHPLSLRSFHPAIPHTLHFSHLLTTSPSITTRCHSLMRKCCGHWDLESLREWFHSQPGLGLLIPAAVLLGSHWSLQLLSHEESECPSTLTMISANVCASGHHPILLGFYVFMLLVAVFTSVGQFPKSHLFSVRPTESCSLSTRNKSCTVFSKKHTLKTFLFGWTLICGVRIEAASGPLASGGVQVHTMTPLLECQLPPVWLGLGAAEVVLRPRIFMVEAWRRRQGVLEFRLFELHDSDPAAIGHSLVHCLSHTCF